jgi:hypothetical protein
MAASVAFRPLVSLPPPPPPPPPPLLLLLLLLLPPPPLLSIIPLFDLVVTAEMISYGRLYLERVAWVRCG